MSINRAQIQKSGKGSLLSNFHRRYDEISEAFFRHPEPVLGFPKAMKCGRDLNSTSLKVAILAIWLLFHAFGSGGLHTILECGHDEAAETFAHQETDSAHWAGLKSAPTLGSECDACTIASQAAVRPLEVVSVLAGSNREFIADDILLIQSGIGWSSARPRAPPLS